MFRGYARVKLLTVDLDILYVIGVPFVGVCTHPAIILECVLLGVLGVADVPVIGLLPVAIDLDRIL